MTPTSLPNPATRPAFSAARAAALWAGLPLVTLAACNFEPETPELRYSLNEKILESPDYELYAESGVAQDQLRGLLELLVGTPSNPGFFLTETMLDDEFDPNIEGGDLTESQWDAIVADNATRFADQIQAIEDGDFEAVLLPREALDLRRWWQTDYGAVRDLRAQVAAAEAGGTDEDGEPLDVAALQAELDDAIALIQEDWPGLLENYYPSLRASAEMYRTQCMHCHGVEGGGDGTTAAFLNPLPRDYRKGIFKFSSVSDKARPTRDDLFRILAEGIYTTAMPSFRRFSDAQLHGLVDYVRLLSIRGRVEELVALDFDPDEGGIPYDAVFEIYDDEWSDWLAAPERVITYDGDVPAPTPEVIARGKELFFDAETANCASCHGNDFRGNGPSSKKEVDGQMVQITDDWGNDIHPRDLTRGIYRFGRRPIDIYRRVHAGINGTPMPAQTTLVDADGNRLLSDDDLWAITHYVRSIGIEDRVVPAKMDSEHADEDDHAEEGGH